MICAVCKSPMIVVEYKQIELDHCPQCHGVWFDAGEMELFMASLDVAGPDQFVSELVNAPEARTQEKKRKCPICAHHMKKVVAGEGTGTLVDVCPGGDGLWFDGGEVGQLMQQLPAAPAGRPPQAISAFFKEVFQADEATGSAISNNQPEVNR